jgi:hypothetical protein
VSLVLGCVDIRISSQGDYLCCRVFYLTSRRLCLDLPKSYFFASGLSLETGASREYVLDYRERVIEIIPCLYHNDNSTLCYSYK